MSFMYDVTPVGGLIYVAIEEGDRFSHYAVNAQNMVQGNPFTMFLQFIQDNLHHRSLPC